MQNEAHASHSKGRAGLAVVSMETQGRLFIVLA